MQIEAFGKGGVQHGIARQDVGIQRGEGDVVVGQADVGVPREEGVRGQIKLGIGIRRVLFSRHGRTCQREGGLGKREVSVGKDPAGDVAGGFAGHMTEHRNAAALRGDHGAFLGGQIFHLIIAAFYVNIRLGQFQKCGGSQFIENEDCIHGLEGSDHGGAVGLRMDGAIGSFEFADRTVAVQTHDQGTCFIARGLEVIHVAGMENIKASVGGGQRFALRSECLSPGGQGIGRENFFLKIQQANPAVVGKGLSIGRARRRFGT